MTPEAFRQHFPGLDAYVHVNNCSRGALSKEVQAALNAYQQDWLTKGSPWNEWAGTWETTRAHYAQLINTDADTIALFSSVSQAIGIVMQSTATSNRKTIVLDDANFPTVFYLARALESHGFTVKTVKRCEDGSSDGLKNAVDETTALVVIPHVSYQTGELFEVKSIIENAQAKGAKVLLDGYQALGIVPTDMQDLQPDYYTSGSHKYLLGMEGIAFLHVRADHLSTYSPMPGWFAAPDLMKMNTTDPALSNTARRYEGGTLPVSLCYGTNAALELLRSAEPLDALGHVRGLCDGVFDTCEQLGIEVMTPREASRRAAMITVVSENAQAACDDLEAHRIIASARGNGIRFSFHAYNTRDEVTQIQRWLASAWQQFNQGGKQ